MGAFARVFRVVLVVSISAGWGCRPEVERQVPCAQTGDLACPAGYHCGATGTCEPGEYPPRLAFSQPAEGVRLDGKSPVEISLEASSPRGLGDLVLQLVPKAGGEPVALTPAATQLDAERLKGFFRATLEPWFYADGEYELVASVAAKGDSAPTQARRGVVIAIGAPVAAFADPPFPDLVVTDLPVVFDAASPRVIESVTMAYFEGGNPPVALETTLEWADDSHRSVRARTTMPALRLPNGRYTLRTTVATRHGGQAPAVVERDVHIAVPIVAAAIAQGTLAPFADEGSIPLLVSSARGVSVQHVELAAGGSLVEQLPVAVEQVDANTARVEATLDPRVHANGAYVVRVEARVNGEGGWIETSNELPLTIAVPAPTIVLEFDSGGVVSGARDLVAVVSSVRDVSNGRITVVDANGTRTTLPTRTEPASGGDPHAWALRATLESWAFGDGDYELVASVSAGLDGEISDSKQLKIRADAPMITFLSPAPMRWVKGAIPLDFTVEGNAPITEIVVTAKGAGGPVSLETQPSWQDEKHLKARVTADVATDAFPDGVLSLSVRAVLASGGAESASRDVRLANAPLTLVTKTVTTSSRTVKGVLSVRFNRVLSGLPTLSAPGWTATQTRAVAESAEYEWEVVPGATTTTPAMAALSAADHVGGRLSENVALPIDITPPATVGVRSFDKRLTAASTYTFVCAEAAEYRLLPSGPSGACSPDAPSVVEVPREALPRIRLTDPLGNSADFAATQIVEEESLPTDTGLVHRAAGVPFLPMFSPTGPSLSSADLAKADGARYLGNSQEGDAKLVGLRLGAIRRTSARPIPFDENGAAVRFGIVDGDVFSLHQLEANGAQKVLGAMQVNGTWRPAWDDRRRAWIVRESKQGKVVLRTLNKSLRSWSVPPEVMPESSAFESIVCGDQAVLLYEEGGGMAEVLTWNVTSAAPMRWGWVEGASMLDVRLTCVGLVPHVVGREHPNTFARSLGLDATFGAKFYGPSARNGFFLSSKGHFAGGVFGSPPEPEAYGREVWQIIPGQFLRLLASGGPARRDGALVARDPLVVLGGRGPAEVGFATSGANGFAETSETRIPIGGYLRSNYDFTRGRFSTLETGSQTRMHEFDGTTWRTSNLPINPTFNGAWMVPLAAPVNALFVTTTPMANPYPPYATDPGLSVTWNGTTATAAASPSSTWNAPVPLLDGRLALFGANLLRAVDGSWSNMVVQGDMGITRYLPGGEGVAMASRWNGTGGLEVAEIVVRDANAELGRTKIVPRIEGGAAEMPTLYGLVPWRDRMIVRTAARMPVITERLTSTDQQVVMVPALSELVYPAPVPTRRLVVARPYEDPPLAEITDGNHSSLAVQLPAGTHRVSVCARTETHDGIDDDFVVDLVQDGTVTAVTAAKTSVRSNGASCARRTFEVTVTDTSEVLVGVSRSSAGGITTLVVDELVVTKTYAP